MDEDTSVMPSPKLQSRKAPKSKSSDDPNHIPRPPNAFILFRQDFLQRYNQSNSDGSSTSILLPPRTPGTTQATLSSIIGPAWTNLDEVEKQKWYDKAKDAVVEHKRRWPNYTFQPKPASPAGRKEKAAKRKEREASLNRGMAAGLSRRESIAGTVSSQGSRPRSFTVPMPQRPFSDHPHFEPAASSSTSSTSSYHVATQPLPTFASSSSSSAWAFQTPSYQPSFSDPDPPAPQYYHSQNVPFGYSASCPTTPLSSYPSMPDMPSPMDDIAQYGTWDEFGHGTPSPITPVELETNMTSLDSLLFNNYASSSNVSLIFFFHALF